MGKVQSLEARRHTVVEEMLALRSLHPGSVNEQFVKGRRDGKAVVRGPYPVLCWREGKKVFSQRLRTDLEVRNAHRDTKNFRRFRELCKELEELTRELGKAQRESETEMEALKKKPKSPSNRTGK